MIMRILDLLVRERLQSAGDRPSAMTNSFTSRTQVVAWIRPSVELDQQLSGVKQPQTFSDSVRRETLINKCERHRHDDIIRQLRSPQAAALVCLC